MEVFKVKNTCPFCKKRMSVVRDAFYREYLVCKDCLKCDRTILTDNMVVLDNEEFDGLGLA